MAACSVAAYRTELFFAGIEKIQGLPTEVCGHKEGDEYRGDRVCNNGVAAAVITVIVCVMLLIIDMLVPCFNTSVSERLNL